MRTANLRRRISNASRRSARPLCSRSSTPVGRASTTTRRNLPSSASNMFSSRAMPRGKRTILPPLPSIRTWRARSRLKVLIRSSTSLSRTRAGRPRTTTPTFQPTARRASGTAGRAMRRSSLRRRAISSITTQWRASMLPICATGSAKTAASVRSRLRAASMPT